jgi:hypothetical protein
MNWTPRPVPFSHAGHRAGPDSARERCAACHHPVQEEIPYLTCASKGCHDNLDRRNTGPNSYYLAVHQTPRGRHRSCVSCHEEHAGDDLARLKKLAGCEESVCHP